MATDDAVVCMGHEFVKQYYSSMHEPSAINQFFDHDSLFAHIDDREGGADAPYQDETMGREAIQQKVDALGACGRRGFCAASAREWIQRHRFVCACAA